MVKHFWHSVATMTKFMRVAALRAQSAVAELLHISYDRRVLLLVIFGMNRRSSRRGFFEELLGVHADPLLNFFDVLLLFLNVIAAQVACFILPADALQYRHAERATDASGRILDGVRQRAQHTEHRALDSWQRVRPEHACHKGEERV